MRSQGSIMPNFCLDSAPKCRKTGQFGEQKILFHYENALAHISAVGTSNLVESGYWLFSISFYFKLKYVIPRTDILVECILQTFRKRIFQTC